MEQRPLRLGDIVDDYCPRERRVTNHAIVALVDDTVKQTRCTTCDHEHVFKHAREPRRRKKEDASTLYTQVLSGLQKTPGIDTDPPMANNIDDETDSAQAEVEHAAALTSVAAAAAPAPAPAAPVAAVAKPGSAEEAEPEEVNGNVASDDEPWSMHRRLIRAQLPRTGNEPPPARPLPDFTIRQPGSRAGQRPWGRGGGGGEANGNTPNANRHGRGGGPGQGDQGGGQGRPAGGGRGGRFAGSQPRPDGGRRGGPGQGGGGGRPGGGGGRGRRSR